MSVLDDLIAGGHAPHAPTLVYLRDRGDYLAFHAGLLAIRDLRRMGTGCDLAARVDCRALDRWAWSRPRQAIGGRCVAVLLTAHEAAGVLVPMFEAA